MYFFNIYFNSGCFGSLLLHAGLSLVAASGGYSAVAVRRLLAVVASFVAEHGSKAQNLWCELQLTGLVAL